MKKEMYDNSFGVAAVVLGIMSIMSGSLPGIVLGIISVVFSKKQEKSFKNKWSKAGFVLGIVGIILGLILFFVSFYLVSQNPSLLAELAR